MREFKPKSAPGNFRRPRCLHCNNKGRKTTGKEIYPSRPDLQSKIFWICRSCSSSYVGCHPGTDRPLGKMCNAKTRKARSAAHRALDPLWKSRKIGRSDVYRRLAACMGLRTTDCHIGHFTIAQCEQVIKIAAEMRQGS